MTCKICQSPDTYPLTFPTPITDQVGMWRRCRACWSDSSSNSYADVKHIYTAEYIDTHGVDSGNPAELENQCRSNCDWFGHHAGHLPNRDFLDIGCCDGAVLRVMASMGWAVHGFDVVEPPYMGPHVTVKPHFCRWWFPQRYAAIMAREVIEHLDSPLLFLHECHGALVPGGLLQVQTPKPTDDFHGAVYQQAHLTIISTKAMRDLLTDAMYDVLDFREWGENGEQPGQAWMCKART